VLRVLLPLAADRLSLSTAAGPLIVETVAGGLHRLPSGATLEAAPAHAAGLVHLFLAGAEGSSWIAELASPLRLRTQGETGIAIGPGGLYPGELELSAVDGALRVVNRVDLETYLRGVVPHELGFVGAAESEAIKAQAIVSRSYALRKLRGRQGPLQATVMDQVYRGMAGRHEAVDRAIESTRGIYLGHGGRPALTLFHSTCAGATDAVDVVWDGSAAIPYLQPVDDRDTAGGPFCSWSKYYEWTESWSYAELVATLRRWLPAEWPDHDLDLTSDPEPIAIEIVRRSDSGRIRLAFIEAWDRRFQLRGERLRWVLRRPGGDSLLRSSKLTEVTLSDSLVVRGQGWGHGLGMCQVGAIERARRGADWRRILAHYYPGTTPVHGGKKIR